MLNYSSFLFGSFRSNPDEIGKLSKGITIQLLIREIHSKIYIDLADLFSTASSTRTLRLECNLLFIFITSGNVVYSLSKVLSLIDPESFSELYTARILAAASWIRLWDDLLLICYDDTIDNISSIAYLGVEIIRQTQIISWIFSTGRCFWM